MKWLECLFAAIDISAPIDDRDFPRDMSIPRIQRLRWFRGESPTRLSFVFPDIDPSGNAEDGDGNVGAPLGRRRSSSPRSPHLALRAVMEAEEGPTELLQEEDEEAVILDDDDDTEATGPHPRIDPVHRLSTTSYPNLDVDQYSGKWFPEHRWSSAHDLLYAKLCYSNLLFRSPRKSNYVVSKGKEWFVDWATGRMVRVLPPGYSDTEYFFGPWQVVHTENKRI